MLPETFTAQYLSQLELLKLRSRRAFLGTRQGGHISPKKGHGIEFSDYRQYELGDNPRHIDWGVFARTERLYVKRFQEEQDLSVLIILDTSASMATPPGEGKWEMARDIALTLSYISLMEHDSVMVSAPGRFHSPSLYGGKAIHALGNLLRDLKPAAVENLGFELQRAISRIRFPGVAVFISDFLMPFETIQRSFNMLRSKNLDITAIQVLGQSDLDPLKDKESAIAIDSETGETYEIGLDASTRNEYATLLNTHNTKVREFLKEARIPLATALTTDSLPRFIQEDLTETGLLG